jgi:hypothetical protein
MWVDLCRQADACSMLACLSVVEVGGVAKTSSLVPGHENCMMLLLLGLVTGQEVDATAMYSDQRVDFCVSMRVYRAQEQLS